MDDKPISVKREELKSKLLYIVNSETLPAILMVDIFSKVTEAVSQLAEYQAKKEIAEWNSHVESIENDTGDSNEQ